MNHLIVKKVAGNRRLQVFLNQRHPTSQRPATEGSATWTETCKTTDAVAPSLEDGLRELKQSMFAC